MGMLQARSIAAQAKREELMTTLSAHCEFADHSVSQPQRMSPSTGRTAACRSESERQEWAVSDTMHGANIKEDRISQ